MRRACFFILLFALFLTSAAFAAGEEDASSLSFRMTGSLSYGEKNVPVLSAVGGKAIAHMQPGDRCQVIGHSGNFYRIRFKDVTGYIRKVALTLSGAAASPKLPEEHLSDWRPTDYVPTQHDAKSLSLEGTIRSESPMDSLYLFIWDARLLRVEKALFIPLPSPVHTLDAASIKRHLSLKNISAGRKILVLEGSRDGEMTVLGRSLWAVRGTCSEPAHVTDLCAVSASQVLSGGLRPAWTPQDTNEPLTVEIPAKANARLLTLEWIVPPSSFSVEFFGEDGALFSSQTLSTGFYADSLPLTADVRKASIRFTGNEKCALSCLRVYPEPFAEHAVQQWEPVPEKVDLMAVSAHQDDEFLFLGGTVPYYCAQGKKVAMVYMANSGRSRYREALDGMWTAGLRSHPIFIGWQDTKVQSLKASEDIWRKNNGGEDPRIRVVRLIRQYRPDVIVTQDLNGEYGHNQHKLTALLWAEAVPLSSDPAFDPASAEQYGVWEVKKLYIHLYGENRITMDWDRPLNNGTPFTARMLTQEAFSKHVSQQRAYSLDKHGKWYDNRLFGLYYSSVGPDVEKNDFFENIPVP